MRDKAKKTLKNRKTGFWAVIFAATCVISVNSILPIVLNAIQDTITSTFILHAVSLSKWWVIPLLEFSGILAGIIINLAYWSYTDVIEHRGCPIAIVSVGWIVAGILMANFPRAPLFSSLSVISFGLLMATTLLVSAVPEDWEKVTSISGFILAMGIPAVIWTGSMVGANVSSIPVFSWLMNVIGSKGFFMVSRSLLVGAPFVVAQALISQDIVVGEFSPNVKEIIDNTLEDIGFIPDDFFNVDKARLNLVVASVVTGFIINLLFYYLVFGEPLYLIPGLSFKGWIPKAMVLPSVLVVLFVILVSVVMEEVER